MKKVLMAAFHYPPFRGSSGVQRTLRFSQYLPDYGWQPIVLTATPNAYGETGADLERDIPKSVTVVRARAYDAARHLSIKGRYPGWLAWPDRWGSWLWAGVIQGVRHARKHDVDVIWSTFPIATAHLIGGVVRRLTGLPWVADFRDPMWEDDYPADPGRRRSAQRIERWCVRNADRIVVTTDGARDLLMSRTPEVPRDRFVVIPNGYDEDNFAQSEAQQAATMRQGGPLRLLHSGALYPNERDPSALFRALAEMKLSGEIDAGRLNALLRATGHDTEIKALVARYGIEDLITFAPPIPYVQALAEMRQADALLLLQGDNCNRQVPAKLYEYMRAGRPILALAGRGSDTEATLAGLGSGWCAPLAETEEIKDVLRAFLAQGRIAQSAVNWDYVRQFDRRQQAGDLAKVFAGLLSRPSDRHTAA